MAEDSERVAAARVELNRVADDFNRFARYTQHGQVLIDNWWLVSDINALAQILIDAGLITEENWVHTQLTKRIEMISAALAACQEAFHQKHGMTIPRPIWDRPQG